MMKRRHCLRLTAWMLLLALLCAACGGGEETPAPAEPPEAPAQSAEDVRAATMHLRQTDGDVGVQDDRGADLPLLEDLGLFDGYQVGTQAQSHAWIDLDRVKLTKLDENTQVEIEQRDRALTMHIGAGGVFFHVTEPLADDESLEIRTASLAVGIRGTCGWVSDDGVAATVGLLEGQVECTLPGGGSLPLEAGWMARVDNASGDVSITPLSLADVPTFVLPESPPELLAALEPGPPEDDDPMGGEPVPLDLPPLPEDGIEREVIEVADDAALQALVEAGIPDNTELRFGDGTYDVGSLVLWESANVSLVGTGRTRLISAWGGDTIVDASGSENLLLYGLVLGHELPQEADCTAGVVAAYSATGLRIVGCDIYGCGVMGLDGSGSAAVEDSVIRDCSELGVGWSNGSLRLTRCALRGNSYLTAEKPLFSVQDGAEITLEDCELTDNFSASLYAKVDWQEDGVHWDTDVACTWHESGTTASGNGWQLQGVLLP